MKKTGSKSKALIDPVCLMKLDLLNNDLSYLYKNRIYYFCADGCRQTFKMNPEKFMNSDLSKRKGFWSRYLERLNKATGGKPPKCCH